MHSRTLAPTRVLKRVESGGVETAEKLGRGSSELRAWSSARSRVRAQGRRTTGGWRRYKGAEAAAKLLNFPDEEEVQVASKSPAKAKSRTPAKPAAAAAAPTPARASRLKSVQAAAAVEEDEQDESEEEEEEEVPVPVPAASKAKSKTPAKPASKVTKGKAAAAAARCEYPPLIELSARRHTQLYWTRG
jgi:hypothetical protein